MRDNGKGYFFILISIILCAFFIISATANNNQPNSSNSSNNSTRSLEESPEALAAGQSLYVATTGNDNNPGTITLPLKTIQKAANIATPGTTVFVRAGIYKEAVTINVSGSADIGYITFQNQPNEKVIIDALGLVVPSGANGLFLIQNKSYLIVKGFEMRNYKTAKQNIIPAGFFVSGASHHIEIRNNIIHDLGTTFTGTDGGDAFGIAVYGDRAPESINNIIIASNQLYNLKLGSSESLVLDGNVENFQVLNNIVHDNNNIGIDVIGFEGVSPQPEFDQARNGIISGNKVYNITSATNPAYGGDRSADGIYVDGGSDLVIERNTVYSCDIGVELASEHAGRNTSNVILRNNFIYRNNVVGLSLGGYDEQRGGTLQCQIVNNTFFQNDRLLTGTGEINIQFNIQNNSFKNNIVYANSQNLLMSNEYSENFGSDFDYNIYFCSNANNSTWQWRQVEYTGFTGYRAGTGNDPHSRFINPNLSNISTPNLHLLTSSGAINTGLKLAASGSLDIDGQPRIQGASIDIGADELPTTSRE